MMYDDDMSEADRMRELAGRLREKGFGVRSRRLYGQVVRLLEKEGRYAEAKEQREANEAMADTDIPPPRYYGKHEPWM